MFAWAVACQAHSKKSDLPVLKSTALVLEGCMGPKTSSVRDV